MSKKYDHLHKYKRVKYGKDNYILRCVIPGCSHYLPNLVLALRKLCQCSWCGEAMIIDKVSVKHANPHCSNCIKRKPKPVKEIEVETKIDDFLKERLG